MAKRGRAPNSKPEVSVTDDAFTYRGPIDLGAASIAITFRASRSEPSGAALARAFDEADPRLSNDVVRSTPLPLAVVDVLARRCVERNRDACEPLAAGESAPDVRWMRALSRALGAQSPSSPNPARRAKPVVSLEDKQRVMALRSHGDRVATLSYALEYGQGPIESRLDFVGGDARAHTHTFSTLNNVQRALPMPQLAPDDALWLTLRTQEGEVTLERWSFDGELRSTRRAFTESAIQRVSIVGDRLWLHCDQHHVCTTPDGARASYAHSDPARAPIIAMRALLTFSTRVFDQTQRTWLSRSAQWIALDGSREAIAFDWSIPVHRFAATDASVFLGTERGVYVAQPFSEPVLFDASAPCYGIASHGDRVAYVVGAKLVVIDAHTHEIKLAVDLPIERGRTMYGVFVNDACVVLNDFTRAIVIDHFGNVQWNSGDRREPVAFTLADGTTVVSAGELVSSFDTKGAITATNAMAYDGQLIGATREHAIFGPVSGGVARTEPDGLYAIDARARSVDSLPKSETGFVARPSRTRYGGGTESDQGIITDDRVLVVEQSGALIEWRPRASKKRIFAESKREPSAKGVTETRFHTSNPRDDWPMAGVELNAVSFYGEDCTWRGTTGVCPERAVVVRNGAVATLVRCKINGDSGGARVTQGSTLILCDCVFDAGSIEVEPGSHVLVLSAADN